MRTHCSLAGLLILMGAATACGSSSDPVVVRSDSTIATVAPPPVTTEVSPTEPAPADIVGTSWLLDSTITIGGPQPVPDGNGAGITIGADGTMDVDTGCNTGSADVTFEGDDSMIVGPVTLTEKSCAADVNAIEADILFVLAEPLTWFVDDVVLVLTPANVSDTGLLFTASS